MSPQKNDSAPETDGRERIAKRIARVGLGSRRDVERWIAEGRVKLNGTVLTSPAVTVGPGDRIEVNGQIVPEPEPPRLWRYYKPAGLVTTARDEKGRPTVFEHLPPEMPRVVSVGRLDLTTEGLLLLTNDGELARFLELPSTGWARRYRVRVHGTVDPVALAKLANGVTIEGVRYGSIEATLDSEKGRNAWLTVVIREGKNREVRKVMESLGLTVNRLIRTSYGPFQLGHLVEGSVEEVPRRVLRDQLHHFFTERGDLEALKAPVPAPAAQSAAPPRISPTRPVRAKRIRTADERRDEQERRERTGTRAPRPEGRAAPGRDRAESRPPRDEAAAPRRSGAAHARPDAAREESRPPRPPREGGRPERGERAERGEARPPRPSVRSQGARAERPDAAPRGPARGPKRDGTPGKPGPRRGR